jgi:hypothetical protein
VNSEVRVNVLPDVSEISGFNPALESTDMAISLEGSEKAIYVVEAGPTATVTPNPSPNDTYVKFKVTMAGADNDIVSDSCSRNMTATVGIIYTGVEHKFENVALTKVGTKDVNGANLVVWQGMVDIGNVPLDSTNAALLVKGPKHVQMKYGVNNQTSYFNQAMGSLLIRANTTNEFDFSTFPMLPGDVVSSSEGDNNPDGVVNGRDYAYVVSKLLSDDSKADLDFSCGVNARDLNLLKITLNERQSQKY